MDALASMKTPGLMRIALEKENVEFFRRRVSPCETKTVLCDEATETNTKSTQVRNILSRMSTPLDLIHNNLISRVFSKSHHGGKPPLFIDKNEYILFGTAKLVIIQIDR